MTVRTRQGRERTIDDLTTLFDLCLVVIDVRRPSSYERLLPILERIDNVLSGADCTVGVLLVGGEEGDAESALGPLARQVAIFADPESRAAEALGLTATPALLWITSAPDVGGVVEGWEPLAWRQVLHALARKLAWARPLVPAPGDPPPFPARPLRPEHALGR